MTDPLADPTAAALREAGWAECTARAAVNECARERCPRAAPCQWCAAGARAAIAAYLRHRADNDASEATAEILREEADAVEGAGGDA